MEKITGNEMAFPLIETSNGQTSVSTGLTIRQHFAAMALQGMLANDWRGYSNREDECDAMARGAINYADALISGLNKPTDQ